MANLTPKSATAEIRNSIVDRCSYAKSAYSLEYKWQNEHLSPPITHHFTLERLRNCTQRCKTLH